MPGRKPAKNKKLRVRLKSALEKRAKDYSLAAVGIGAVAFSPAASAAVTVVTLNHVVPVSSGLYTVNVGGHNVLRVTNSTTTTGGSFSAHVYIRVPALSNRFWGPASLGLLAQPPVTSGANIPGAFPSHTSGALVFSTQRLARSFTGFIGNGKFIGYSVGSGPNIHYGWVEFNISQPGGKGTPYSVTVVAAAYETTAGLALAAGATTDGSSPGPAPTPAPNSLWLLALGAAGLGSLELLRRRKEV